jgi:hypothetical protein
MDISQDYKERYKAQSLKFLREELEFHIDLFAGLYKQIRWGEGSGTFFKAEMIKAVNFIVTDNKELDKRTRALEVQLKVLNERFKKTGPHVPGEKSSGAPAEENKKIPGKEKKAVKVEKSIDPGSKEDHSSGNTTASAGKEDPGSGDINALSSKLDEILKTLKKKKIPVYAMFVESEPSRIEKGTLYFVLSEDKKWHKDHLNKVKNVELISGIIEEVTGIKYKIKFELGGVEPKNNKYKDSSQAVSENPADDFAGEGIPEDNKDPDPGKDTKAGPDREPDDPDDVFKYFEKKFKIKE